MDLNKQILREKLNNPKNVFGDFCSVENILNPEFNEAKEYEKILWELEIMDDFEGKVAKKIYFLRHPEADKSVENWDLTEKWKKDLEQKAKILKNYLKNSKIVLRYAGISKNRDIVFRIAKTAEILYKKLWKNIVWIVQENGLDTREKVEFKGKNDIYSKIESLDKQEASTREFYNNFFESLKKDNSEIDSEIHIVHSTNLDIIYRIINEEYHPKETWYHKLQMWEAFEIEISSSWDILKEKNEFIHLNSENYSAIIEELENVGNEKISKAIKYFKNWKIKIIDLQNVINKQILENNWFLNELLEKIAITKEVKSYFKKSDFEKKWIFIANNKKYEEKIIDFFIKHSSENSNKNNNDFNIFLNSLKELFITSEKNLDYEMLEIIVPIINDNVFLSEIYLWIYYLTGEQSFLKKTIKIYEKIEKRLNTFQKELIFLNMISIYLKLWKKELAKKYIKKLKKSKNKIVREKLKLLALFH